MTNDSSLWFFIHLMQPPIQYKIHYYHCQQCSWNDREREWPPSTIRCFVVVWNCFFLSSFCILIKRRILRVPEENYSWGKLLQPFGCVVVAVSVLSLSFSLSRFDSNLFGFFIAQSAHDAVSVEEFEKCKRDVVGIRHCLVLRNSFEHWTCALCTVCSVSRFAASACTCMCKCMCMRHAGSQSVWLNGCYVSG